MVTISIAIRASSRSMTVEIVAQGDLSVNGNTNLKGQLFTKKNITTNGQTTIVGSIDALLNVTIGGNTTIVAK